MQAAAFILLGLMQDAEAITDPAERAVAEKSVRMQILGTVRLIAQLYRKDVVKETITLVCIRELLDGKGPKVRSQRGMGGYMQLWDKKHGRGCCS